MYDGAAVTSSSRRTVPSSSETIQEITRSSPSDLLAPRPDDGNLSNSNVALTDNSTMESSHLQLLNNNTPSFFDLSTQPILFNDSLTFDIDKLLADNGHAMQLKCYQSATTWCTWAKGGICLSIMTDSPSLEFDPNLLAMVQAERPQAQYSANIIIQALRALPTMMLRRETFPWFIHTPSQLISKSSKPVIPDALSTCMSISQMFASRTAETKSFLWSTIRNEYRRLNSEVSLQSVPYPSISF